MDEEKIEVKHADELVDFVKGVSKQVYRLRIGKDVDYMGCSRSYVYEKVQTAIHDLEWIIDRIAELKGDVVRCEECRDFAEYFDKYNLCARCSDEEEDED